MSKMRITAPFYNIQFISFWKNHDNVYEWADRILNCAISNFATRTKSREHLIETDSFFHDIFVYELGNWLLTLMDMKIIEFTDGNFGRNINNSDSNFRKESISIESKLEKAFELLDEIGALDIVSDIEEIIRAELTSRGRLGASKLIRLRKVKYCNGKGYDEIPCRGLLTDAPLKILMSLLREIVVKSEIKDKDNSLVDIYYLCRGFVNSELPFETIVHNLSALQSYQIDYTKDSLRKTYQYFPARERFLSERLFYLLRRAESISKRVEPLALSVVQELENDEEFDSEDLELILKKFQA